MIVTAPGKNGLHADRDGTKYWYKNGLLHREDGPAIERTDGSKEWWLHGELHRESGPAIERADGTREWWRDGEQQNDNSKPTGACQ